MTSFSTPHNARPLSGDTYVIGGLTNSGFVDGLVVDTCEDEAPYAGVSIDTLAITHGHADHFAVGFAVRDMGARVFAARDDAALVENPDINIRGMFSWARPSDALTTKLFRGTPCDVDAYLEDWDDDRATVIPLPGHTLGHSGLLTRDGVFFTGDALYPAATWERHPLPYAIDPGMVAESLRTIRDVECEWIVPAHAPVTSREAAEADIAYHLRQIAEIEELIVTRLAEAHTTEEAVAMVSAERGLGENSASYWLAVTTVKGYLGDLLNRGAIEFYVQDHKGWWRTAR